MGQVKGNLEKRIYEQKMLTDFSFLKSLFKKLFFKKRTVYVTIGVKLHLTTKVLKPLSDHWNTKRAIATKKYSRIPYFYFYFRNFSDST